MTEIFGISLPKFFKKHITLIKSSKKYILVPPPPYLSSRKIHEYEYLTGKDILPSNQQQIIEKAKFTYSSLGKTFEKQIKTIEDQGQK